MIMNRFLSYKRALVFFSGIFLFSFAYAFQFPSLTAPELKASLESGGVVVYDVRTEGEYLSGHVPGAINVN